MHSDISTKGIPEEESPPRREAAPSTCAMVWAPALSQIWQRDSGLCPPAKRAPPAHPASVCLGCRGGWSMREMEEEGCRPATRLYMIKHKQDPHWSHEIAATVGERTREGEGALEGETG